MNIAGDIVASDYTHDISLLAESMQTIRALRDRGWFVPTAAAPHAAPASSQAFPPSLPKTRSEIGEIETARLPANVSSAIGAPLTSAYREYFQYAIQRCWNVPASLRDGGERRITIAVELTIDGNPVVSSIALAGPQASPEGVTQDLFESGRRALIRCAPYLDLPKEKFAQWRSVEIVFNSEGLVSW